jgi:hypothetical protein
MIKNKPKRQKRIEIDLSGPDGNAWVLMGLACRLSRQLSLNEVEIIREMKESDYENLIQVFDKYFGNYVTLYR